MTPSGAAFLPEARAAVEAADRAQLLARQAALPRKPLKVGVISVALWEPLRALLRAARTAGLAVELVETTTNEQLRALCEGRLDFGYVAPPFEIPPRLQVIDISGEPVVAAIPTAEAGNGPVRLDALAERLVLFPRADGPVLHDAIMAMFRLRGLTPTIVQESPRIMTSLALVAAGVGVSIVSAPAAASLAVRGVAFRPITPDEGVPNWPVALAHMPLSAHSDAAKLLAHWRRLCAAS